MFNYQHILIGLDGSELSERAFSEAIEMLNAIMPN